MDGDTGAEDDDMDTVSNGGETAAEVTLAVGLGSRGGLDLHSAFSCFWSEWVAVGTGTVEEGARTTLCAGSDAASHTNVV